MKINKIQIHIYSINVNTHYEFIVKAQTGSIQGTAQHLHLVIAIAGIENQLTYKQLKMCIQARKHLT